MASDFAGAGGLVCAGISFPDKNNVQIAEITKQGSAAGREGAQVERAQARSSCWGEGRENRVPLTMGGCLGELCAWR